MQALEQRCIRAIDLHLADVRARLGRARSVDDAVFECGGPGVGAVGMCFTGNFALSMMLEPSVVAPVLAQPSLPLNDPSGLNIAPDELARIRQRLDDEDLSVLAYRFEGDLFCRAERFAAYRQALGERFVGRVLPDAAAGPKSPQPERVRSKAKSSSTKALGKLAARSCATW